MVTLLNMTVFGLVGRLGASTASSAVKPSLLLVRAVAKAVSAGLPRGPIIRSICATSLPSPTSDSPTISLLIFAILAPSLGRSQTNAPPTQRGDWLSLFSASRRMSQDRLAG